MRHSCQTSSFGCGATPSAHDPGDKGLRSPGGREAGGSRTMGMKQGETGIVRNEIYLGPGKDEKRGA
jgi:hypothetical protein